MLRASALVVQDRGEDLDLVRHEAWDRGELEAPARMRFKARCWTSSVPRLKRLSLTATIFWASTIGISVSSWSRKRIRSQRFGSSTPSRAHLHSEPSTRRTHSVPLRLYSCRAWPACPARVAGQLDRRFRLDPGLLIDQTTSTFSGGSTYKPRPRPSVPRTPPAEVRHDRVVGPVRSDSERAGGSRAPGTPRSRPPGPTRGRSSAPAAPRPLSLRSRARLRRQQRPGLGPSSTAVPTPRASRNPAIP